MYASPGRHEALQAQEWDERAVRQAIEMIAADALAHFDPQRGWPCHALDDPQTPDTRYSMLYYGAGGVIWALQRLRQAGAVDFEHDFTDNVVALPERNRVTLQAWGDSTASWLMGDAGLLLLQWQFTQDPAVADQLYRVVEGNIDNPTREALWGAPGSVLAALHMAEASGEARWPALFAQTLQVVFDQMEFDASLNAWLWTQDLYGRRTVYLGAAHGFIGNIYPTLRGAAFLPEALRQGYAERALQTLTATAVREPGLANWLPVHDPSGATPIKWLVQDCHGAPGVVCRAAAAPATPAWNSLLRDAAELTWRAGPLAKGAGLCHGTAGNGFAFLTMYRRSGDRLWLDRARAFASHALMQVEQARALHGAGRYSLWTGDLGVALFAWACLEGDANYPTLDVF